MSDTATAPPQEFPTDWACCTRYGVPIAQVGEEGEFLVAPGQVEPRRMTAACNRHERECLGLFPGDKNVGEDYDPGRVLHTVAARVTEGEGEYAQDLLRWYGDDRTIPITVHRAVWA